MKTLIEDILSLTNELGHFDLKKHSGLFRKITECSSPSFYATMNNLVNTGLLKKKVASGDSLFALTSKGRSRLGKVEPLPVRRRRKWDGSFRLLLFSIPERLRSERDMLREYLRSQGFGMIHNSVWMLPHEISLESINWLKSRRYDRFILFFQAERNYFSSDSDIFNNAWKLDELKQYYNAFRVESRRKIRVFLQEVRADKNKKIERGFFLWMMKDIDETFSNLFFQDPFLPRKFLPLSWPGDCARSQYRRLRRKLVNALNGVVCC
ncbi:MAG: PaaX family transcriptional regulator C-terminal domain-containing protein [Candidatus Theseobacter exili]|nr:PaaX family transcriptional regulator C-terminal domain-containing protein [Candidatus Theseobacter exili]